MPSNCQILGFIIDRTQPSIVTSLEEITLLSRRRYIYNFPRLALSHCSLVTRRENITLGNSFFPKNQRSAKKILIVLFTQPKREIEKLEIRQRGILRAQKIAQKRFSASFFPLLVNFCKIHWESMQSQEVFYTSIHRCVHLCSVHFLAHICLRCVSYFIGKCFF